MDVRLQVISNIIIPSITGIFFFMYFLYFVIVNHSRAASFLYFIVFLLSFSIFQLGRPLQLLLGQHPVQLIIVNIRMLIFCIFSITSITIASNLFSDRNSVRFRGVIFCIGLFFGITYIVFNTLGTTGSMPIFKWGGMDAYDALTPAMRGPYYGREVTIVVQVSIGFLLLANSLINLSSSELRGSLRLRFGNKTFLFNSGVFLFALTFIIGSFTKQWWLYYFASMFSAILFGAGVVLDIRELHNNYERLIPIIKEDIIQNVAFSTYSQQKLRDLLGCLGKSEKLDTFAVLGLKGPDSVTCFRSSAIRQIAIIDNVMRTLAHNLDLMIGNRNYLLIPLDENRIGVVLNMLNSPMVGKVHSVEFFEKVQFQIFSRYSLDVVVGIGRSYENMEDLHTSYHDALNALEYAENLGGNALIHVNNIQNEERNVIRFPAKEKAQLLSALKMGDGESSLLALESFLSEFKKFAARRPIAFKPRLYELAGSLIDNAILVGGDKEQLNGLVEEYFNNIKYLSTFAHVEEWLRNLTEQLIHFVSRVHKSRSALIIDKAKEYIAVHFTEQISYKDVAKELFISSSYFQALFKQELGSTFVEYLTELRMTRAKELLLNSNITITEISFDIGISNPNYFSSIFKKSMGMSAKEFRKRQQDL